MQIRGYLPSAQFTVIVVSIGLSVGLVYAANYVTSPKLESGSKTGIAIDQSASDDEWRRELEAITGGAIPPASYASTVGSLVEAAKTGNVTESVGRSLLLNLSAAAQDGTATDIPTQDGIIAAALAQASAQTRPPAYDSGDIADVRDSKEQLRAYGNAVMRIFNRHLKASYPDVQLAIAFAVENESSVETAKLSQSGAAYTSLAAELSDIAVPSSLVPLHLQLINNFAAQGDDCKDIALVLDDPLRALAAYQSYDQHTAANLRVFTTIAEQLKAGGILFTKDEPGSAWSLFNSTPQS